MTVDCPNISCSCDSSYVLGLHLNQRSHETFLGMKGSCEFNIQKDDPSLSRLIEVDVSLDGKFGRRVGTQAPEVLIQ